MKALGGGLPISSVEVVGGEGPRVRPCGCTGRRSGGREHWSVRLAVSLTPLARDRGRRGGRDGSDGARRG